MKAGPFSPFSKNWQTSRGNWSPVECSTMRQSSSNWPLSSLNGTVSDGTSSSCRRWEWRTLGFPQPPRRFSFWKKKIRNYSKTAASTNNKSNNTSSSCVRSHRRASGNWLRRFREISRKCVQVTKSCRDWSGHVWRTPVWSTLFTDWRTSRNNSPSPTTTDFSSHSHMFPNLTTSSLIFLPHWRHPQFLCYTWEFIYSTWL